MSKEKKTTSCRCVEKANEELASRGVKIVQLLIMNFQTREANLSPPSVVLEKTNGKKGKMPSLFCSYCPFCGVKLSDK